MMRVHSSPISSHFNFSKHHFILTCHAFLILSTSKNINFDDGAAQTKQTENNFLQLAVPSACSRNWFYALLQQALCHPSFLNLAIVFVSLKLLLNFYILIFY